MYAAAAGAAVSSQSQFQCHGQWHLFFSDREYNIMYDKCWKYAAASWIPKLLLIDHARDTGRAVLQAQWAGAGGGGGDGVLSQADWLSHCCQCCSQVVVAVAAAAATVATVASAISMSTPRPDLGGRRRCTCHLVRCAALAKMQNDSILLDFRFRLACGRICFCALRSLSLSLPLLLAKIQAAFELV